MSTHNIDFYGKTFKITPHLNLVVRKPVFEGFDLVPHKLGCTTTEDFFFFFFFFYCGLTSR